MRQTDTSVRLSPHEAVEKYLNHRKAELSEASLYSHKSRLGHFVEWCEKNGIEAILDLQPHHLQDYRVWREQDDLSVVTLNTKLSTLRVVLKWAEDYGAAPLGLHERVRVPDREDDARSDTIAPGRAEDILEYCEMYEYATKYHALFKLLWDSGIRIGAARAIDLDDFHPDEEYVDIRHRPESDTPIKNQKQGERPIALSPDTVEVLSDYIEARRPDVTDKHGREPLIASTQGRPHVQTLRKWVYHVARPCWYNGGECPHGRELSDCDAASSSDHTHECPSSFSPHSVRRGSITRYLADGVYNKYVSDRMNVGVDTIEKHYDQRTPEQKMENRKDYFK
jgi:site-specific recombinase XerD